MKKLNLVVLAADVITQWSERFAFDYSTLRVKDRVPLDFLHLDDTLVGYAEGFQFSDEKVTADAVLMDDEDSPSARAREIAYGLDHGVPYETSCLIDLEQAVARSVQKDETVVVNGREISGPLTLYQNAEIRGVAICPHGADALTSATVALSAGSVRFYKEGKIMSINDFSSDELRKKSESVALAGDDSAKETSNGNDSADGRSVDAELIAFVDEFGAEKGLDFYRRGISFADARLESLRLAKELADKEVVALRAKVKELEAKVAELSAPRVGDPVGVVETAKTATPDDDPLKALAAKYKKNGVVRLS